MGTSRASGHWTVPQLQRLTPCGSFPLAAGLGKVAARSLQAEYDDAVAALQMATEALAASQQRLAAAAAAAATDGPPEQALAAVRQVLAGAPGDGANVLAALQARLAEWEQRVSTNQDPSRLLRWAGSGKAASGSTSEAAAGSSSS